MNLDPAVLAVNLSFVLHERSDSAAVSRAAAACKRHAARMARSRLLDVPCTVDRALPHDVELWLSASVGAPPQLAAALRTLGLPPAPIECIDAPPTDDPVAFFRAPANLALPAGTPRVAVVGLVLRPDGHTTHLVARGPFEWPGERDAALREVERLIQAHAGQWMPSRALWDAPAEALLSGEIL